MGRRTWFTHTSRTVSRIARIGATTTTPYRQIVVAVKRGLSAWYNRQPVWFDLFVPCCTVYCLHSWPPNLTACYRCMQRSPLNNTSNTRTKTTETSLYWGRSLIVSTDKKSGRYNIRERKRKQLLVRHKVSKSNTTIG